MLANFIVGLAVFFDFNHFSFCHVSLLGEVAQRIAAQPAALIVTEKGFRMVYLKLTQSQIFHLKMQGPRPAPHIAPLF